MYLNSGFIQPAMFYTGQANTVVPIISNDKIVIPMDNHFIGRWTDVHLECNGDLPIEWKSTPTGNIWTDNNINSDDWEFSDETNAHYSDCAGTYYIRSAKINNDKTISATIDCLISRTASTWCNNDEVRMTGNVIFRRKPIIVENNTIIENTTAPEPVVNPQPVKIGFVNSIIEFITNFINNILLILK